MPKTTKEYNCECGCHTIQGNPLDTCQHCDYNNKWFSQSEVDDRELEKELFVHIKSLCNLLAGDMITVYEGGKFD